MAEGTVRCSICGALNPAAANRCAACWGEILPGRTARAIGHREGPRSFSLLAAVGAVVVTALVVWSVVGVLVPRYPRSVRVGLIGFTVTGRQDRPTVGVGEASATPDNVVYRTIVLAVTVRNHGERRRPLDPPSQLAIVGGGGHLYRALPSSRDVDLPDTIPPGGEVAGHVAFRVPADTTGLRLTITMDRTFKPGDIPIE